MEKSRHHLIEKDVEGAGRDLQWSSVHQDQDSHMAQLQGHRSHKMPQKSAGLAQVPWGRAGDRMAGPGPTCSRGRGAEHLLVSASVLEG